MLIPFFFLSRDVSDERNINVTLYPREIISYIIFTSGLFEFTFILRSRRHCLPQKRSGRSKTSSRERKRKKEEQLLESALECWAFSLIKTSRLPGILPEVDKEKRAGKILFCGFASLTV